MTNTLTLVLGGTGKTGHRVAQGLRARGLGVRIGSRAAVPAFDWEAQGGWPAVLEGVAAVYIAYHPDLAVPGAPAAIQAFTDLAVRSGVRRLVLLSGRGEPQARRCEDIVRRAGTDWTVVRASWFCQNFSEGYLVEPIRAGLLALPVGPVGEPFVDARDVAEVALAALTEHGHAGQAYEVTGPRLWTFAEAAAEIGRAAGRRVGFVQLPMDDYAAALQAADLPPDEVALIRYLFTEVLDGRNASIADGVQKALGRPPTGFADYARETAAAGVWG
ncbi:NmrA family transcriptional regulator [Variovorax sp. J22P271]|uniref:NAD(P)H-binding protein n=1 Tax=Variovorax davisae TaxID=3053515 RepID=UPI0025780946|nr:NAD(P)H-binding protein [Variovorax sp. J22P271]MDM0034460.1 NmrA family transcriptional regulator [Variovorax sp. J22P271]